jgi:hypothetical protein
MHQVGPNILERLPLELLTEILQLVCEDIMRTLQHVLSDPNAYFPLHEYFLTLSRYPRLHMVCRTFHVILNTGVRVNGTLIGQHLIDHQISRLVTFLDVIDLWADARPTIKKADIEHLCGRCWFNPRFAAVATSLLKRKIDDGVIEMIYFRAPDIWPHRIKKFTFEDIKEFRYEETKNDSIEAKRSAVSPATAWLGEVLGHKHICSFTPGRYKLDLEVCPRSRTAISGISIDDFQLSEFDWRWPEAPLTRVGHAGPTFHADRFSKSYPNGRYWLWCAGWRAPGSPWPWNWPNDPRGIYYIVDYENGEMYAGIDGMWLRR